MTTMTVSELQAKLPSVLSRLKKTNQSILVLKKGKPVAKVIPCKNDGQALLKTFRGAVADYGDIVSPLEEPWAAGR